MATRDQPGDGWTVVLRRRPAAWLRADRKAATPMLFEIICCDCGDHPYLDYREVSPELQRIRGPYPVADGITAYEKHSGCTTSRHVPPAWHGD